MLHNKMIPFGFLLYDDSTLNVSPFWQRVEQFICMEIAGTTDKTNFNPSPLSHTHRDTHIHTSTSGTFRSLHYYPNL